VAGTLFAGDATVIVWRRQSAIAKALVRVRLDTVRVGLIIAATPGGVSMSRLDNCYNVYDLRDVAKRRLPKAVFEFVDRSTEDEIALRNNRLAFEKIRLRHRALVDVSGRSTKTTLFGKEISLPMAIAPTGAAGLCWHEGELELAKAAARAKIPFTLATGAMTSMEKIAKEANFRLWFQLYVWKQRELSYQLIERAKNNGFEALIVTTDTIVPPNREYNAKNGFLLPFHPTWRFTWDIMQHPVWFSTVLMKYFTTIGMPRNENYPDPYRRPVGTDPGTREVMRQDSLNWDDIRIFRDKWPGILMLKGINRVDDALKAVSYGVDGVIVSNHGGRNMDSAAATLDMLPEIAEAVGDKATVILDSGVRRGSDIVKALALGAKCVLTGRATLYGTAAGGQAGASKAVGFIQTEMDKTMAYTGCNGVDEISTDIFFGDRERNRMMAG
jgi:(S)-mandelate dehydrogenase